jgi:hypothetical protein
MAQIASRVFPILTVAVCLLAASSPVQDRQSRAVSRNVYDEVLDLYVRDGYVYYRALKLERAKFDAYVASLSTAVIDSASKEERLAFWLNVYNALVLRTVIDRYPIPQRTGDYPRHSIRQIPGAFERVLHRVAGRTITLDQIEQTILPTFHDPRVYLALGRGAVGGGRLRSEAFSAGRLEAQLKEVADECVSRAQCVQIDREANLVSVSAIFSWREEDFVSAYAESAPEAFGSRSPIERAVLTFVEPKLLTIEREFLVKNQFQVAFTPFDWSLNDLTGRGGR